MTPTDHAAALEWAAEARNRRARLLDDLTTGRTALADAFALASADPFVGLVKVQSVLEALPGARKVDTRRTLSSLGIDGRTPLDGLGADLTRTLLATFPLTVSPSDPSAADPATAGTAR